MTSYRSYEDYDANAAAYDDSRVAVGVEIVLGVAATARQPLSTAAILDVGCGTGNYLRALAPHVRRVVGLEYSAGMLGRARRKRDATPGVELARGTAFALPFDDATFDAVMFNQVVHHFDVGGATEGAFPMLRLALENALRVLRPGGRILINHCTQRQVRDGFWWMGLIPRGCAAMAKRYIPVPAMCSILEQLGFRDLSTAVPTSDLTQPDDYLDPRKPLDALWRRSDSTWALVSDEELTECCTRLESMIETGSIESWLAERETLRCEVGQTTYVWGTRP